MIDINIILLLQGFCHRIISLYCVSPSTCGGSDAGSHCSSMESLLESRKPDPEEILLELGFGGVEESDTVSR